MESRNWGLKTEHFGGTREGAVLVESLSRLLAAATALPETGDLDRPHIVVTVDPVTGVMGAFGPFAGGIGALRVANHLQDELNGLDDGLPPIRAIPLPLDVPLDRA